MTVRAAKRSAQLWHLWNTLYPSESDAADEGSCCVRSTDGTCTNEAQRVTSGPRTSHSRKALAAAGAVERIAN